MGESFGAVVSAAVALRCPELLAGVVLVNPATAYSQRPGLQDDCAILRRIPAPLFKVAMFATVGWKSFDTVFISTILQVSIPTERSAYCHHPPYSTHARVHKLQQQ